MELSDWQQEKVDIAIDYICDKRDEQRKRLGIEESDEIIDVKISDDTEAAIVIKINNSILQEAAKGSNFILILYINQYSRNGLLDELFTITQSSNYRNFFFVDELIASPMNNNLVPKYEVCTEEMVFDMLNKYHITIDSLPKLFLKDPAARWNSFEIGNIIRITRPSGGIYYRLVVE